MDLKELTRTQYGDFQGIVSIDRQEFAYQKLDTFDLPEGILIGMGFDFGEIKIGSKGIVEVRCTFLIAAPKYGDTMQEVINNIPSSGADVIKVNRYMPFQELGKLFKRFNCCGIYKDLDIRDFNIKEDE